MSAQPRDMMKIVEDHDARIRAHQAQAQAQAQPGVVPFVNAAANSGHFEPLLGDPSVLVPIYSVCKKTDYDVQECTTPFPSSHSFLNASPLSHRSHVTVIVCSLQTTVFLSRVVIQSTALSTR